MNPATLEFYLPLMIRNSSKRDATAGSAIPGGMDGGAGALEGHQERNLTDRDARFRRGLPDQTYVKRMVYRGVLMRMCTNLQNLDGLTISGKERKKAETMLQRLELEA